MSIKTETKIWLVKNCEHPFVAMETRVRIGRLEVELENFYNADESYTALTALTHCWNLDKKRKECGLITII